MSEAMYEVPGSRLREMTDDIARLQADLATLQAAARRAMNAYRKDDLSDEWYASLDALAALVMEGE